MGLHRAQAFLNGGLEAENGGVRAAFWVFVGFKSKFNFTRGGTNCSKLPFLCVGMVCKGYEYSTLFVRSIIPRGAVRAILYICCEIRKSAAEAALKCRVTR